MKTITPAGPQGSAFQNIFLLNPGTADESIALCAHRHDHRCEGFHYHASEASALRCWMLSRPDDEHERLLLWRCRGELFIRVGGAWVAIDTIFDAPAAFRRLRRLAELGQGDPNFPHDLAA